MKLRWMAVIAAVALVIGLSGAAMAQVKTDPGVARISLIHGEVSTQRGDSGDWSAAALNAPVVEGDKISTGQNSRGEIQLDYANILRLAESAQANITGLSRTQIQIQLGQGLANYSVVRDGEADVEIDTPNMSLHPTRREGSYRIFVLSDEETQVEVRKGEADVATPQGHTHIGKGQMITVRGTGNDTQYQIADARSKDDFDRWNNDRDNTIRNAQAWSRTNDYYVGSEDLDAYGHWTSVPDYGQVWVPAVSYGWAPYRAGRWVWEPYWGWTWVSYEPWGWAPYHYGRWMFYGSSWVWWPGPVYGYRHYRPIWAPAYVSFFGFGHGVGVGVGFGFGGGWGSIGWLPVGPCDGFYPWWGGYRSRFNVVNVTNINVYNVHNGGIPPLRTGTTYSNIRLAINNHDPVLRGVSTVPANDFGRGRITATPVSRDMWRDGKMVAGNLPVVPIRDSLLAGERRAGPPTTVRGVENQRFFGTARPVTTRESFDREAANIKTAIQHDGRFTPVTGNPRSTVGETNPRSITPQNGNKQDIMRGAKTNEPVNGNANQSWRRFGQTDRPATPANTAPGNREAGITRQPAGQGTTGQNQDWRRSPSSAAPVQRESGSPMSTTRPGNTTTPDVRRAPSTDNNQQWRRPDQNTGSAPRGTSSTTEAPASRDRQESTPVQDRGNDWRRFPSMQERNDSASTPSRSTAAETQRDSGNWRQAAPRDYGRETSRPQLDMRQPIVTPRSSGPSGGGYHGGGGGGGASRPAPSPSHGGGGGGHPSGGGGGHSSGGGSGPHRGR